MGVTASAGGGGCRECERLREENRVLREENCVLKERLDLLESSAVRAGWYKPSVKPVEEEKKPGRREGHVVVDARSLEPSGHQSRVNAGTGFTGRTPETHIQWHDYGGKRKSIQSGGRNRVQDRWRELVDLGVPHPKTNGILDRP